MSYIGNTAQTQGFTPAIDYFSGNASTTAFTLSRPVASVAQVQAVIENVPQNPGDAFSVSGNTITFTSAPPSGANNIYVYYTSPITQVIQPGQGTVYPTSLSTGGPYWDTSGNVGIGTTSPSNTKLHVYGAWVSGNSTVKAQTSVALASGGTVGYGNYDSNGTRVSYFYHNSSYGAIGTATSVPMIFETNATERMRIDSSGRVTMPYQPAFRAKINNSAYVSITNGAVLPFGVAEVNVGGHYNTSTYRFTAPVGGTYAVNVSIYTSCTNSADAYPGIRVNGTRKVYSYAQHGSITGRQDVTLVVMYLATLNAGDYVDAVIGGNGSTYNGTEEAIFQGYLLG